MPDYVLFGTATWDSSWLTDQNLAAALGRRHRVLYVEPPMSPLTPLRGGRPADLAQAARRVPRAVAPSVHALRPVVAPPVTSPAARRLSRRASRRQVARAVRAIGLRDPVVIAASWAAVGLEGAAGEALRLALVKDLVVAGADLLGQDQRRLARDEDALVQGADLVLATSQALVDHLAGRGVPAELLPHGFADDVAAAYDAPRPPADLRELPSPRLGYAGTIDDRLDFEALERLAAAHPDGTVVLVGPVSPRLPPDRLERLERHENVVLLGPRRREELPAYLSHLDCCLLPHRDTAWARHAAPLKLWDYLYAGPPIAGTGYGSLRTLGPPLVHFVDPPRLLPDAVASALAETGASGARARRELALANTWQRRAERVDELVEGLQPAPQASPTSYVSRT